MRICLVAHKAYGAIRGGASGHIGGIERQTSVTARWLAQRGHATSLVTWNEDGSGDEEIDGVRLVKLCAPGAGLPGARFFHPKWTSLLSALRRAKADVYYQNGAGCETGQVGWWCRSNRRRFVFSVAHDFDCEAGLPHLPSFRERALYRYGLRHADARIVQTQRQGARLRSNFGLESEMIPMPYFGAIDERDRPAPVSKRILWVGRVTIMKRPHIFLELAESCPEWQFDLVGPFYTEPYAQEVKQRAERLPNVTVHGGVARENIPSFYAKAACLCCTSEYEGFPNTFLEAWGHGLPIFSTFDPDSLIASRGLGAVARDASDMKAALVSLFAEPEKYREVSGKAWRYVSERHRSEVALPHFERVMLG